MRILDEFVIFYDLNIQVSAHFFNNMTHKIRKNLEAEKENKKTPTDNQPGHDLDVK